MSIRTHSNFIRSGRISFMHGVLGLKIHIPTFTFCGVFVSENNDFYIVTFFRHDFNVLILGYRNAFICIIPRYANSYIANQSIAVHNGYCKDRFGRFFGKFVAPNLFSGQRFDNFSFNVTAIRVSTSKLLFPFAFIGRGFRNDGFTIGVGFFVYFCLANTFFPVRVLIVISPRNGSFVVLVFFIRNRNTL